MSGRYRVQAYEYIDGYEATTHQDIAMLNGYIGEVPMYPKFISNAVAIELSGKRFQSFTIYYYGKPDERLSKMFGY